jgi:lipoyl(octanoyl) transferase
MIRQLNHEWGMTSSFVEWAISERPVAYPDALGVMQQRAGAIAEGRARELIWLLEHPPLYTAGTSAKPSDLIDPDLLPVFASGRGGQYTYHGPGQRIAYVMLNLKQRGGDVRGLVSALERWIALALEAFNVQGETRPGRVGIWVRRPEKGESAEDKIAALGLRVTRGVTTHGISLNVDLDLSHYRGIVACGIAEHGVTSLTDLGLPVTMADADVALRRAFEQVFGPVERTDTPVLDRTPISDS